VRFGDPARPLFGVFHPAAGEARSAVLLCYPMPPEYMLSHRAFQRLAASLASAGHDVLRFDYRGTGDSAGDAPDACVERWTVDVEIALAQLRERTTAGRLDVVGLRLGAALAARVAATDAGLDRAALWEPVLQGPAYLDEVRAIAAVTAGAGGGDDALDVRGFELSPTFQRSLMALEVHTPPMTARLLVLESQPSHAGRALAAAHPDGRHAVEPGLDDWAAMLDEGNVVLPHASLRRIVEFITDE